VYAGLGLSAVFGLRAQRARSPRSRAGDVRLCARASTGWARSGSRCSRA